MSDLLIPGTAAPNNLHFAEDVQLSMVEHDLYDICTRIKEVDPSLFIVLAAQGEAYKFIIMEHCTDGTDRLVWKCDELDQRILTKCERMKAIPFEHRFAEIEKEIDRDEEERKHTEFEKLYEDVGRPMRAQFAHDGFIDRKESFPITSRKHIKPKLELG